MGSDSWGVIGHEWPASRLRRAVTRGELGHAYLISGPSGVGKTTLALALARALLCQGNEERPCNQCQPCHLVSSGSHPDLHRVDPGTSTGRLSIDQVRDLTRQLSLTPSLGSHRIAILTDFDRATPSAANALLKTLEEPPEAVVLVLIAADTDSLLPTIVSRCHMVSLRPMPVRIVKQALQDRWGVEPGQADLLAHLCGGRLGWAVRAATDPDVLPRRAQLLQDLFRLLDASLVERFGYATEMARDLATEESKFDLAAAEEVLDIWASWWRDVMLVAAGASGTVANLDLEDQLRAQARSLGPARSAALVRATSDTLDRLRRNANPRLSLEVLIGFDLPRM